MPEEMVAFCGIVCTDCRAFIATQRNDRELKEKVAKAWSTEKETLKPEDIDCDGCLTTGQRLHTFCAACEVRRCGYEKGVENCAYCREYPCVKLTTLWKSITESKPKATLEGIRKKSGPDTQQSLPGGNVWLCFIRAAFLMTKQSLAFQKTRYTNKRESTGGLEKCRNCLK